MKYTKEEITEKFETISERVLLSMLTNPKIFNNIPKNEENFNLIIKELIPFALNTTSAYIQILALKIEQNTEQIIESIIENEDIK